MPKEKVFLLCYNLVENGKLKTALDGGIKSIELGEWKDLLHYWQMVAKSKHTFFCVFLKHFSIIYSNEMFKLNLKQNVYAFNMEIYLFRSMSKYGKMLKV